MRSRNSSRPQRGHLLISAAVKAKSARQVACSKTLVAKPEHAEEVKQLCQQAMEFSQKQMGNRSSGIQEFTCSADGWEPNVFYFWERYDSNVSLGKHNTTPEMEQFMNKVGRHGWLEISWCGAKEGPLECKPAATMADCEVCLQCSRMLREEHAKLI
jgi:quinol monooxygenase YgiN